MDLHIYHNLSNIAKRMITVVGGLSLALIVAGIACFKLFSFFPFLLGVIMGAGVTILRIVMLERAVNKALEMDQERAANYLRLQHLLRYLVTGAVLVAAALLPPVNLWGAIAGVMTMPVATFFSKKVV